MKQKPVQREYFQQSSYLFAGCFEKWKRNQHSENTSNKSAIYLLGVLENETETNSTARTLPTKQVGIYLLGVLPRKYIITVYNLFFFLFVCLFVCVCLCVCFSLFQSVCLAPARPMRSKAGFQILINCTTDLTIKIFLACVYQLALSVSRFRPMWIIFWGRLLHYRVRFSYSLILTANEK